jgi:hypothetical protein
MTYKNLSQTERYQIYARMKAGQSPKTIAQILGRHKSTIGRELLRILVCKAIDLDWLDSLPATSPCEPHRPSD